MADDSASGYTPSGSKDLLSDYIVAAKKVASLKAVGEESLNKKKDAKKVVADSEKAVKDAEKVLEDARNRLDNLKTQRDEDLSDFDEASSIVDTKAEEFALEMGKKDQLAKDYHSSIPHYEGGLSKESTKHDFPLTGDIGNGDINIRTLGDVHGWGPGLLAFLLQNELATVTLNGEIYTEEKLPSQFLSPFEYFSERVFIEGPWLDRSPYITPGEIGEIFRGQVDSIDITPSSKLTNDSIFIQVGDLIDRGDWSELTLETMRQLIQKSPANTLSLVGNHEAFLIDYSFKSWLKNEQRNEFDRSRENIAGSIRLDKKRAGSQSSRNEFQKSVFSSYSAHYAHLLLTQEYRLRMSLNDRSLDRLKSITQPSLDLASIDDSELERIATSNDWGVIERSLEWLDAVRKEEASMALAGAVCMFSVGHSLFLHAESTALMQVTDEDWSEFGDPFKTKTGAEYRMLFYATADKKGDEKIKSRHYPLLWTRSKGTRWLLDEVPSELEEAVEELAERMPWITNIYHGHTPIKQVHTLNVDTDSASIKVTNLDWSWTPPYLSDAGDPDPYSVERKVQYRSMKSMGGTPAHTRVRSLAISGSKVRPYIEGFGPGSVQIGKNKVCTFEHTSGREGKLHVRVKENYSIVERSKSGQVEHGKEFRGVIGSETALVILHRKKWSFWDLVLGHYSEPIAIIHESEDLDWPNELEAIVLDEQAKEVVTRREEERKAEKAKKARDAKARKARQKGKKRSLKGKRNLTKAEKDLGVHQKRQGKLKVEKEKGIPPPPSSPPPPKPKEEGGSPPAPKGGGESRDEGEAERILRELSDEGESRDEGKKDGD